MITPRPGETYEYGRPFTSDLSGQDFWTLLRTGHRPVGMVMGSCVYHVAHQDRSAWTFEVDLRPFGEKW